MATVHNVSLNITLTTDPLVRQRLHNKLAQYQARLGSNALTADLDLAYKLLLLQELLETGEVSGVMFAVKLRMRFGWYNEKDFENAFAVIRGYNSNDLTDLRGGGNF